MQTVDMSTAKQLRQYIERIERLEEDKAAIAADIREVIADAKNQGFDTKVMRQILKIRKMDSDERDEIEHLLDTYLAALDMTDNSKKTYQAESVAA